MLFIDMKNKIVPMDVLNFRIKREKGTAGKCVKGPQGNIKNNICLIIFRFYWMIK